MITDKIETATESELKDIISDLKSKSIEDRLETLDVIITTTCDGNNDNIKVFINEFKHDIQMIAKKPFVFILYDNGGYIVGTTNVCSKQDSASAIIDVLNSNSPNDKFIHPKWNRGIYPSEVKIDGNNATVIPNDTTYTFELKFNQKRSELNVYPS